MNRLDSVGGPWGSRDLQFTWYVGDAEVLGRVCLIGIKKRLVYALAQEFLAIRAGVSAALSRGYSHILHVTQSKPATQWPSVCPSPRSPSGAARDAASRAGRAHSVSSVGPAAEQEDLSRNVSRGLSGCAGLSPWASPQHYGGAVPVTVPPHPPSPCLRAWAPQVRLCLHRCTRSRLHTNRVPRRVFRAPHVSHWASRPRAHPS